MKNKDAIKLFLDKEGKELRGKKNFNFIILAVIFLFSIVSIGFGSASLNYLDFKMNDPFVNWIKIVLNQQTATSDKIPLSDFLNNKSNQTQYQFSAPEDNYILNMFFVNSQSGRNIQMTGIRIAPGKLMDKILGNDNCIEKTDRSFMDGDLGIILTLESAERLGYNKENLPSFVYLSRTYDIPSCESVGLANEHNGYFYVAFPVVAIVKQLPGMNSFLFTNRFFRDCCSSVETTWDITDPINNKSLTFVGEKEDIERLNTLLSNKYAMSGNVEPYRESWNGDLYKVTFMSKGSSLDDCTAFYNKIVNENQSELTSVVRLYDFVPITNYELDRPSSISVQIDDLDAIRTFQEALSKQCGINLEMTNVEAKENFNFVQRMGNVLSICIIFLSLLFICFFIYFMLSTHFQKIQMNLGTFKAFGISNKTIFFIYNILLLRITLFAYLIAFLLVLACSLILNQFTSMQAGTDFYWIDIFTWQNVVLLCMSLFATIATSTIVARNMLANTPGDLIYNRTNN